MDKYTPKSNESSDTFIGKIISSESYSNRVMVALGVSATGLVAALVGYGYLSGSFDSEETLDTGIIECAIPMADEDPTLQETEVNVIRCDTRGSLNEAQIRNHAQVAFNQIIELMEES
jgi:hypothetical protein